MSNRMAPVLWVIAVLGNLTVIHRIIYTWQQSKPLDVAEAKERAAAVEQASVQQ